MFNFSHCIKYRQLRNQNLPPGSENMQFGIEKNGQDTRYLLWQNSCFTIFYIEFTRGRKYYTYIFPGCRDMETSRT